MQGKRRVRKGKRVHGWIAKMRTPWGAKVINARRSKGRKRLITV